MILWTPYCGPLGQLNPVAAQGYPGVPSGASTVGAAPCDTAA